MISHHHDQFRKKVLYTKSSYICIPGTLHIYTWCGRILSNGELVIPRTRRDADSKSLRATDSRRPELTPIPTLRDGHTSTILLLLP